MKLEKPKIAIFGGGIAGLTIAHECIEAGMEVDVYERNNHCGGKAICRKDENGNYTEHAFRVYPSTYFTLYNTLKRIPYKPTGKTVFDNLIPVDGLVFTAYKTSPPDRIVPTSYAIPTHKKLIPAIKMMRDRNIPWGDVFFFFRTLLKFMTHSDRRLLKLREKTLVEYCGLNNRSKELAEFMISLAETSAAIKAGSSALIPLNLFARTFLLAGLTNPNKFTATEYIMNGPTSERFIDPWVEHLTNLGVRFHMNSALETIHKNGNEVEEILMKEGTLVKADAYAFAASYQTYKFKVAGSLGMPAEIEHGLGLGAQIHLKKIPSRFKPGILGLGLGSPWRIAFELEVSPVWQDIEFRQGIAAILSITLFNSYLPGSVYHKPMSDCTLSEFHDEILSQMAFTAEEKESIDLITLDPSVRCLEESEYKLHKAEFADWIECPLNAGGYRWIFETSSFAATPETYPNVPRANTPATNMFLAGEFVECAMPVPNMEKANQTGKLCAEAIFKYFEKPFEATLTKGIQYPMKFLRKMDALFH